MVSGRLLVMDQLAGMPSVFDTSVRVMALTK